ncbi:MAG TPA: hypothetical protein VF058_11180 [Actinomycetota bacterium]
MSANACSVHPDVPARETCGRCGRAACLGCAVPVRGEIRCRECVGDELGEAVEAAAPPRSVRFRDLPAGLLFLAAVLVSLLPWDRQGSRAGFLSAWTPVPEPWPFVAGVLLLLAAVASLRGRRSRPRAVHIGLGVLAVLATLLALPSPGLSTRGPVPIVVLGLAVAATLTGVVRATAAFGQRP